MTADLHTHILPGVDDGSRSVAESLKMLERCARMGVRRVVLTPHFYADRDRPDRFLPRRQRAYEALTAACGDGPYPELILGAEVHYYPNMSSSDILPALTIGGGRYLLVEMPMCRWTDQMYRELEQIWEKQGLIPIIAHVERYITLFTAPAVLKRLSGLHVLIQANGSFFLRPKTARLAMWLLERGQIHLLGSDCHDLKERKPNLGPVRELIRSKLGKKALQQIAHYEKRVLDGGAEA